MNPLGGSLGPHRPSRRRNDDARRRRGRGRDDLGPEGGMAHEKRGPVTAAWLGPGGCEWCRAHQVSLASAFPMRSALWLEETRTVPLFRRCLLRTDEARLEPALRRLQVELPEVCPGIRPCSRSPIPRSLAGDPGARRR